MNNNINTANKSWQEEEALKRFQLIAPLLQSGIDEAKKIHLRKQIAEEHEISTRSLYRYEKAYSEGGFYGLIPINREKRRSQKLPENFEELLSEAIVLKKEVPERSVEQIIYILELEGRVEPGRLKRSTMERYLYNAGFGVKHLQTYKDARNSSSKRFCRKHRMELIQGDIKYGPMLPIGKSGAKVQTYLSSAIDDHSRYVLASKFYNNQELAVVEDTFHSVINRYGKFDACYFDNGKQYVSTQLQISLSRLGIQVKHAKIRSGKSKGKIEKFHQVVDDFLRESRLKSVKTLDELNRLWTIYLEEYYSKRAHDGIREYYESLNSEVPENGISPIQEFNRDSRPLCFLDVNTVAEAFKHHEQRKVDKGACISFRGKLYETKPSLIGFTVEISYDPALPEILTVSYPGIESFIAKPVRIGSYCSKTDALPVSMQAAAPATSRFLDALELKYEENKAKRTDAISFASLKKEVDDHV